MAIRNGERLLQTHPTAAARSARPCRPEQKPRVGLLVSAKEQLSFGEEDGWTDARREEHLRGLSFLREGRAKTRARNLFVAETRVGGASSRKPSLPTLHVYPKQDYHVMAHQGDRLLLPGCLWYGSPTMAEGFAQQWTGVQWGMAWGGGWVTPLSMKFMKWTNMPVFPATTVPQPLSHNVLTPEHTESKPKPRP